MLIYKMKNIALLLVVIMLSSCLNAFADERFGPAFLEKGKTCTISYLIDRKVVSENHLPLMVTILAHGPDNWYLIKRADGAVDQLWVNFDSVVTVQLRE